MAVKGDVIAIARHEGDFYQLTFTNVCRAGAANFVREAVRRSFGIADLGNWM
jgi:hypothetical protein